MALQMEKQAQPFTDIFDEDEAERSFLLSKPACLVVMGKPGSGKKTLARKLAQRWNCIFIEEFLYRGESVPEELVTEMILQKIESPEVAHFGYVLTGFPSLSEEYMTVPQQIEKIKNLKLKPDVLINIKCPDYDLCQRISGQRQHPDSGELYQRSQWDRKAIEKRKRENQDEEEEEEDEEQEEEDVNITPEGLRKKLEYFHEVVHRPEDSLENAEKRIGLYKDMLLHPLEVRKILSLLNYLMVLKYMIFKKYSKNDDVVFFLSLLIFHQKVFRKSIKKSYVTSNKNYTCCYCCFNKQDELFRALSSCNLIAPRYRWRRSRWGQACPVALKEGDIVMGSPDFSSVGSFLGKMYVLSSQEALKKFMLNPRPYLLPPMPLPPCKVFVFGPPLSGRTTTCNAIAHNYKGKVEVTADDPEVQAIVEEAMKSDVTSPQIHAEILEDLMKTNKDRFPGASEKGGWVVDNYPLSANHWAALSEKGLLPDTVVCLKNTVNDVCLSNHVFMSYICLNHTTPQV
uniref:Uncharacterized protein n=1 Tax=Malurus cyaneus samueli TaxID=2593467 RepID=A0A8C5T741_9PASS